METEAKTSSRRTAEALAGYVFLAPFLAVLVVFTLWPLLQALWLSLHSYDLFSPAKWVGLDNYVYLLKQADFWISIRNTAFYTFVVVTAQTVVSVVLALIMDQKLRGKTFFRTVFFLPSVTSSVAISLIFMFLFFKNGLLNQLLGATHLDSVLRALGLATPVDWLGDTRTALPTIMIQNIWSTAGFLMIVVLAGLQDIPESLYEAARVDGASALQQFWYITLPSLKPTLFYVITMGLIGCFQVFDQVYVMTVGGPLDSTRTMVFDLYDRFRSLQLGQASAVAYLLLLMSVISWYYILAKAWSSWRTTRPHETRRPTPTRRSSSSASRTPGSNWPAGSSSGRGESSSRRRVRPSCRSTRIRSPGSGRGTSSLSRITPSAAASAS